jgi:hypothetical protein
MEIFMIVPQPGLHPGPSSPAVMPVSRPVNVWAVIALVLSICAAWPVAIVLGVIALAQHKRPGGRGRGLAIAALVISVVWALTMGAAVVAFAATGPSRNAAGRIDRAGSADIHRLRAGDCIVNFDHAHVSSTVSAVACTQPHNAEVFAVFPLDGAGYPGQDSATELAVQACSSRVHDQPPAGAGLATPSTFAFAPSALSWRLGNHNVECVVYDPEQVHTGPLATD